MSRKKKKRVKIEEIEFSFSGMSVGLLSGPIPEGHGTVNYMPFRGSGHYEMQQSLERDEPAPCTAEVDGKEIRFTVYGCPEYGVLSVKTLPQSSQPR